MYLGGGWRVIGISRSLIWSKTLELIFNSCCKFRWSPEGPVSQIHSPHLHVGAPGMFADLLRSVQMLKREWGAESNGKLPHLFIPSNTATLIPDFAVEDCLWTVLQSWFLRSQWMTCPLAEHSDDDDDDDDDDVYLIKFQVICPPFISFLYWINNSFSLY